MDYHSAVDFFVLPTFSVLAITPAATTVLIFLIVLLFCLSFLFAGSEVAFFSLTYKDLNMLKTKQKPAYRRIVSLLDQPKTLLAAMLITNSFVNIGISLISNILIDSWISSFNLQFWPVFLIKVGAVSFLLLL